MRIALETENEKMTNPSNRNENVVYYVAGYVILKFYKGKKFCDECAASLQATLEQLPDDFTAPEFTDLKNKGKLKFASCNMFNLMLKTENIITEFCINGRISDNFAFQDILYSLREEELPKVGCDNHFEQLMANLVHDYMVIRCNFIGKKTVNGNEAKQHMHSKI